MDMPAYIIKADDCELSLQWRSALEASDGPGAVFYMDSMLAGGNPEKDSPPACLVEPAAFIYYDAPIS